LFSVQIFELKQETFTVYEREEVLIECSVITNNKNDCQPYWEQIDENDESCNLTIREDKEGRYGLKKYPSRLTILDTQMSDSGYYHCCNRKETTRSKKVKLIIEKSGHIL
jgi:hypothetical protein